ncbi:unnamed protein product [Cuscuta epithymum]|uniref:Uncharacterized protein n=1 Tax=Cuscuta epithymum TaxID=186058 RepID=A0AAV0DY16_9ASTE|nr:unnamed protein product [Cuscuta epithymum]
MQVSYKTKQNKNQKQQSEHETKYKKQQENKHRSGTSATVTSRTHQAGLGTQTYPPPPRFLICPMPSPLLSCFHVSDPSRLSCASGQSRPPIMHCFYPHPLICAATFCLSYTSPAPLSHNAFIFLIRPPVMTRTSLFIYQPLTTSCGTSLSPSTCSKISSKSFLQSNIFHIFQWAKFLRVSHDSTDKTKTR